MDNPATCEHTWTKWIRIWRIGYMDESERHSAERTCTKCSVKMISRHHICALTGHDYIGILALPLPDVLKCMYCDYSKPSSRVMEGDYPVGKRW